MEKNTRTKNILLIVLLVAVLTLSISYAALSQTLYINSEAVVGNKANSWNVKFTAATCSATGYAVVTHGFNETQTTSLSGLVGTLKAPGDTVTCEITVSNAGAIDAELDDFDLQDSQTQITITGSGTSKTADENLVANSLNYTLVYKAGGTATYDSDAGNVPASGDKLAAGSNRKLTLTIELDEDLDDLPENDVTFSNLKTTFLYVQD